MSFHKVRQQPFTRSDRQAFPFFEVSDFQTLFSFATSFMRLRAEGQSWSFSSIHHTLHIRGTSWLGSECIWPTICGSQLMNKSAIHSSKAGVEPINGLRRDRTIGWFRQDPNRDHIGIHLLAATCGSRSSRRHPQLRSACSCSEGYTR